MSLLITINNNDRLGIVIPAEFATVIAGAMASAQVVERGGWGNEPWTPAEHGVKIEFVNGEVVKPEDPRMAALKKESDNHRDYWLAANRKNEELTKQVSELSAALEAIKSVTVCQQVQTDAAPAADSEEE